MAKKQEVLEGAVLTKAVKDFWALFTRDELHLSQVGQTEIKEIERNRLLEFVGFAKKHPELGDLRIDLHKLMFEGKNTRRIMEGNRILEIFDKSFKLNTRDDQEALYLLECVVATRINQYLAASENTSGLTWNEFINTEAFQMRSELGRNLIDLSQITNQEVIEAVLTRKLRLRKI